MPIYLIRGRELISYTATVIADSKEEAFEKYEHGDWADEKVHDRMPYDGGEEAVLAEDD